MSPNQFDRLVILLTDLEPTEAHHGDCTGADDIFHQICLELKIPVVLHPPKNLTKCAHNWATCIASRVAKDYLVRNHDIVDESDELIAVPGEKTEQLRSGTWATYRYGKKTGKTVHLITP